jgi:hypothetical protein
MVPPRSGNGDTTPEPGMVCKALRLAALAQGTTRRVRVAGLSRASPAERAHRQFVKRPHRPRVRASRARGWDTRRATRVAAHANRAPATTGARRQQHVSLPGQLQRVGASMNASLAQSTPPDSTIAARQRMGEPERYSTLNQLFETNSTGFLISASHPNLKL